MAASEAAATRETVTTGPRREILIILPGLLLAIMLAMLDQLVVSTALPRIVGDLGGVTHLSWVVTAYVLASTVTTPLYGKLGDLYGRKRLLMAAIVLFLVGSALSGMSHSMDQLIAFRALQGLGAGGLLVGAIATIGDLVSPRERGQYMGYMMAAMTLAMVAGPLVVGYITDSLSWRWIFYINMPIGGAALLYLAATLHLPRHKVQHKIDYLGAVMLAVATTSIVPTGSRSRPRRSRTTTPGRWHCSAPPSTSSYRTGCSSAPSVHAGSTFGSHPSLRPPGRSCSAIGLPCTRSPISPAAVSVSPAVRSTSRG